MKDFSSTARFSTMSRTYQSPQPSRSSGRSLKHSAVLAKVERSTAGRSRCGTTRFTRMEESPHIWHVGLREHQGHDAVGLVEGPGETVGADVSAEDHRQHVGGIDILH